MFSDINRKLHVYTLAFAILNTVEPKNGFYCRFHMTSLCT